jgi:hypothetical protein
MKSEEKVKVTIVKSHGRERSMTNKHCGEPSCMGVNSQGGPTIQTTVSLRGYVSVAGELRGEKRVTQNH